MANGDHFFKDNSIGNVATAMKRADGISLNHFTINSCHLQSFGGF